MRRVASVAVLLFVAMGAACAATPPSVASAPTTSDACANAEPYAAPPEAERPLAVAFDASSYRMARVQYVAICLDGKLVVRTEAAELAANASSARRELRVTPGPHRFRVVAISATTNRMGVDTSFEVKGTFDSGNFANVVTASLVELDAPELQNRPKIRWAER